MLDDRIPRCECGGLIKPDIVFYGENLDEALLDGLSPSWEGPRLLLVLGSSLTVQPPPPCRWRPAAAGGKIVIVNAQPTPLDRYAALRYDDRKRFSTRCGPRRGSEEEPSGPFRICASCVC